MQREYFFIDICIYFVDISELSESGIRFLVFFQSKGPDGMQFLCFLIKNCSYSDDISAFTNVQTMHTQRCVNFNLHAQKRAGEDWSRLVGAGGFCTPGPPHSLTLVLFLVSHAETVGSAELTH